MLFNGQENIIHFTTGFGAISGMFRPLIQLEVDRLNLETTHTGKSLDEVTRIVPYDPIGIQPCRLIAYWKFFEGRRSETFRLSLFVVCEFLDHNFNYEKGISPLDVLKIF